MQDRDITGRMIDMVLQYTAMVFMTVFAMLIMLIAVKNNSFMTKTGRNGFAAVFILLIVVNVAEWIGAYCDGASMDLYVLHVSAKFTEFVLTAAIPIAVAVVIGGDLDRRIMCVPVAINLVLQIASLSSGIIFCVDQSNIYHRGPFYVLYIATVCFSAIFMFVQSFRLSRHYQNRHMIFLSLIVVLVFAGITMQLMDQNFRLDWACVSIAAILYYIYFDELVQQTDALTALLNRRCYDISMENLHEPAAIVFFDVDHFKNVNDDYGHSFGDVCLKRIAYQVRSVYGKAGNCYRYGGDEFCAIIRYRLEEQEAMASAFMHSMEKVREKEPKIPRVSVGYAIFDPEHESAVDALRRADAMMYEYKKKNRVAE